MDLHKKVTAVLNRLTISNIQYCAAELSTILDSKVDAPAVLDQIIDALLDQIYKLEKMGSTFHIAFAAIFSYLYQKTGDLVVSSFLKTSSTHILEYSPHSSHLIKIIGILVLFDTTTEKFLLQLAIRFLKEFDEDRASLILVIFRICGLKIRNDSPEEFTEFFKGLEKHKSEASIKLKFLIECIDELKNNRSKLRFDMADINIAKQNLASALKENKIYNLRMPFILYLNDRFIEMEKTVSSKSPSLKNISKSTESLQRMSQILSSKTPARKSVLSSIASSKNVPDSVSSLLSLRRNSEKWDMDIISTIIDCCASEASFNPFYHLLLCEMCRTVKKMTYFVRVYLYNFCDNLDKKSALELKNVSILFANLVFRNFLALDDFKMISSISSKKARAFMMNILTNVSKNMTRNSNVELVNNPTSQVTKDLGTFIRKESSRNESFKRQIENLATYFDEINS